MKLSYSDIKKAIDEIELLKDKITELEEMDREFLFSLMQDSFKLPDVELEENTEYLLREALDEAVQKIKKLLEYELGERFKQLNILEK